MAHRCDLCSAPMLGEPTARVADQAGWNICFMCVLAAEEAVEALDAGFRLGPPHPEDAAGGRYCIKQRPSATADAADNAFSVPAQYETLFRPIDDSPTRWF